MNETSWKYTRVVLKSLLIRIASVGLCIAVYKRISDLADVAIRMSSHPSILLLLVESKGLKHLKGLPYRGFISILLCFAIVFPVLKTLLNGVCGKLGLLVFSLCQVIFCVDSVKSGILSADTEKRSFEREDVISLEEGILIPMKFENTCACGNIAAMIGLMVMASRAENWVDAVVLQAIGFILYLFLPGFLENRSVHRIPLKIFLFLGSFFIFMFLSDKTIFTAFAIMELGIAASISILAMAME